MTFSWTVSGRGDLPAHPPFRLVLGPPALAGPGQHRRLADHREPLVGIGDRGQHAMEVERHVGAAPVGWPP
nr:hypothetical protein [Actinoplanes teichomyceticus]